METSRESVLVRDEPHALLLAISGHEIGRVFLLDEREKILGRSAEACIRLDQPCVSLLHARLYERDGLYFLEDLHSTNGTEVNDALVTDEVALAPGDVITIGEARFAYLTTGQTQHEAHTLAIERYVPRLSNLHKRPLLAERNDTGDLLAREPASGPSFESAIVRLLALQRLLARRWPILLPLALLGAALGHVATYVSPPPAQADVELRLRPDPRKNPLMAEEGEAPPVVFDEPDKNFASDALLRATLKKLGTADPAPALVRDVQSRLGIESVALHTYRGRYADTDPQRAVEFLETHVRTYVDAELEKMLKVISAETEFLSTQYREHEAALERSEQALLEFRKKHPTFVPGAPEREQPARLALASAASAPPAGRVRRIGLELDLAREQLRSEDAILEKKVEAAQPYQSALTDVERKIGEAKSRGLGERHPELENLRRQAADLKRRKQSVVSSQTTEIERRANPRYGELRAKVRELEITQKLSRLEIEQNAGSAARQERLLRELPELELQYGRLTRSYEADKDVVAKLFQKLKQSKLKYDLERTSASARYELLSPPNAQALSVRMVLLKRTLLGFALGTFAGLLLIGALELWRYVRSLR